VYFVAFWRQLHTLQDIDAFCSTTSGPLSSTREAVSANLNTYRISFNLSKRLWKYLEVSEGLFRGAEFFSYNSQTVVHFADAVITGIGGNKRECTLPLTSSNTGGCQSRQDQSVGSASAGRQYGRYQFWGWCYIAGICFFNQTVIAGLCGVQHTVVNGHIEDERTAGADTEYIIVGFLYSIWTHDNGIDRYQGIIYNYLGG